MDERRTTDPRCYAARAGDEGCRAIDEEISSLVVRPSSVLVIGLGNPSLGDDGVGWRVAEEVKKRLRIADCGLRIVPTDPQSAIEVDCLALGGLSLMERLVGYEQVVLIDAFSTGQKPAGAVYTVDLAELPNQTAGHTASAHDTSLLTALKMGRALGARLPERVTVVAVEAQRVYDFSEELTPPVAAAVPFAVESVLDLLRASRQGASA